MITAFTKLQTSCLLSSFLVMTWQNWTGVASVDVSSNLDVSSNCYQIIKFSFMLLANSAPHLSVEHFSWFSLKIPFLRSVIQILSIELLQNQPGGIIRCYSSIFMLRQQWFSSPECDKWTESFVLRIGEACIQTLLSVLQRQCQELINKHFTVRTDKWFDQKNWF